MTDPKIAADDATNKITVALVTAAGLRPDVVGAIAPTINGHVLAAITRCICAPSDGLGR